MSNIRSDRAYRIHDRNHRTRRQWSRLVTLLTVKYMVLWIIRKSASGPGFYFDRDGVNASVSTCLWVIDTLPITKR